MQSLISKITFAPNTRSFLFTLAAIFIASAGVSAEQAVANESTAFNQVTEHYETVRLALTNDSTDGVSAQGKEIEMILAGLAANWSPTAAGIPDGMTDEVRGLLPELGKAAAALSAASSIEAARDAFYELSKLLVRWRKAVEGDKPVVAYCSMSKRSWLQPQGEIGNPYHGQSMPRCGQVVDG